MKNIIVRSSWLELAISSSSVLGVRVFGAGLGFVFNVVLARVLGASGLGVYQLALTFVLVASIIARLGMDAAMLRFAATSFAEKDWGSLVTIHKLGMAIVVLASVPIVTVTYFSADWIAATCFSNSAIAAPLRLMSLALIPFSLFNLYGELLKAGHKQISASFVQAGALPLVNLCAIYFFADKLANPAGAAKIYLASTMLVSTLGYVFWKRGVLLPHAAAFKTLKLRELFEVSLPMYLAALSDVIMTFSDILILGIFVTSAELGIYSAAARTALLTRFVLLATSSVVAPKFAALHAAKDYVNLEKLAVGATFLTLVSTLPLLMAFILFPDKILSIFGPTFVIGGPVLMILALGQFVNAGTGPVGYLLNMSGHHRIESRIALSGAMLTIGFCFSLIPFFGIIGAAMASAIATSVCNLLRVYFVKTRLGINVLPFKMLFGKLKNISQVGNK